MKEPLAVVEASSLTPRTYEHEKQEFCKTEAEIDAAFKTIASRWRDRCATDPAIGTTRLEFLQPVAQSPASPRALRIDTEDDVEGLQFSRFSSARSRVDQRIAAAQQQQASPTGSPTTAKKSASVPLLQTADGTVLVNVRALQRKSVSQYLRPVGSQQALKPHDIDRACKARIAMKRPKSAPNIVQRNRLAEAVQSWRPEVRQTDRMEKARAKRHRAAVARLHRQEEVEAFRVRACNAARERVAAHCATEQAEDDDSHEPWRPRTVRESLKAAALCFRWIAVEAFLGHLHADLLARRRAVAELHWELAVKFVRLARAVKRWRRRIMAADLLRRVAMQVPWTYRTRMVFRKHRFAATRIQTGWRLFNAKVVAFVEDLLNGPWQRQELWLLEMIFSVCSHPNETIVEDPSLLCIDSMEELARAMPERRLHGKLQRGGGNKAPGAAVAKSRASARPTSQNRWKAAKKTLEGAQLQAWLQQEFEQSLQQKALAHRFRREVASRILRMEILERLYEVRSALGGTHGVATSAARRKFSSSIRRVVREARSRSRSPATITRNSKVASRNNSLSVEPDQMLPARIRPSDEDVAEIVLCAHCAQGVRPARPDVWQTFYRACPQWRLTAVSELLASRRTISEALIDRWSAYRGHHRQSLLEQLGPFTNAVQLPKATFCHTPAPITPAGGTISPLSLRSFQREAHSPAKGSHGHVARRSPLSRPASAPAGGRSPATSSATSDSSLRRGSIRSLALDKGSSCETAFREVATAREAKPRSFEDCFASAEAFCRSVLAHEGTWQAEDPVPAASTEETDIMVCYSTTKTAIGSLQGRAAGSEGHQDLELLRMLPGLDPVDRPERVAALDDVPNSGIVSPSGELLLSLPLERQQPFTLPHMRQRAWR